MNRGVYPAAVTPFAADGSVDLAAVGRLLGWFASAGCRGVVLAGTNGEGPSLSATEKRDLILGASPFAAKLGLEVVLGIATPSLDEALWLCRQAERASAEAVLLMAPYYFREATEAGLEAWFRAVLDKTGTPVLIYNFPKRAGMTISAQLLARLADHPMLLGAKDSSGERSNLSDYRAALPNKRLYVGDESLLLDALAAGWDGSISGAANVLPNWLSAIVAEFPGESALAKFELASVGIEALRRSPQPAANKAVLHRLGVLENADPRLPLLGLDATLTDTLMTALKGLVHP